MEGEGVEEEVVVQEGEEGEVVRLRGGAEDVGSRGGIEVAKKRWEDEVHFLSLVV